MIVGLEFARNTRRVSDSVVIIANLPAALSK